MLDQVIRLLGYDFAQNAIAAGIVIAVVSGVVSRFVVARNTSFAVHALAELGFTGAAGAILVGVSPVLGLAEPGPPSPRCSSAPSGFDFASAIPSSASSWPSGWGWACCS